MDQAECRYRELRQQPERLGILESEAAYQLISHTQPPLLCHGPAEYLRSLRIEFSRVQLEWLLTSDEEVDHVTSVSMDRSLVVWNESTRLFRWATS